MPGQHPEDSVGDCIESVLDDNPDLDEESAARICNAELKAGLDADQKAALVAVEKAASGLGDTDRAQAIGQRISEKLSTTPTGQKTAVAVGQQAPVRPADVQPAKVDGVNLPDLDPSDPPEEFAEALQADDFILFGKASIEQFDKGGENSDVPEILDMDAIAAALDRFFDSEKAPGIVSIAHDDIPVGRPLREYTLDEDTTIEVGGDVFEFEAGETLETHVEDGDGDGKPELWALSDLANETPIHRKVRLGVLMGELDGYSVTFGRHPESVTQEGPGRRVGSLDLFSWTLAPGDMVANPGAEFDLAAFKAMFGSDTGQKGETEGYTLATDGDPGPEDAFEAFLDALVDAGGDVWQVRNGELHTWPDDRGRFPRHDPTIRVVGVPAEEFQAILDGHDVEFMHVSEGLGHGGGDEPPDPTDEVAAEIRQKIQEVLDEV